MTEEDIAKIETLAQAATPGPWSVETGNYTIQVVGGREIGSIWICTTADHEDDIEIGKIDAAFIAACRNGVPDLLQHIKQLTAERDAARATLIELWDKWPEPFQPRWWKKENQLAIEAAFTERR